MVSPKLLFAVPLVDDGVQDSGETSMINARNITPNILALYI